MKIVLVVIQGPIWWFRDPSMSHLMALPSLEGLETYVSRRKGREKKWHTLFLTALARSGTHHICSLYIGQYQSHALAQKKGIEKGIASLGSHVSASSAWEGEHEIFDKKLVISALVSMSISSFYPIGSMGTWFNVSGTHGNLMRVKVLSIGQCSCEKWSRQKISVVSVFCGLMFSASEKWVSGSFFRTLIRVVHCRILTGGQHGLQRWQPCLDYMSHCRERYPKMWFFHTV